MKIDNAADFDANELLDGGVGKIFVTGNTGDTVDWYGSTTSTVTGTYDGITYNIYTQGDNQLWVDVNSKVTVI